MPARKTNVGAQRCVIHRVRNSAGSATSRGLNPPAAKKSRVWSSAISTITTPRRRSMETIRVRAEAAPPVPDLSGAPLAAGRTARRSDSKVRLMTRYLSANALGQAPLGAQALVRRRAGALCSCLGMLDESARAARPQDARVLRAPTASRRVARGFRLGGQLA